MITLIEQRNISLNEIIWHRLALAEAPYVYEIFSKKQDDCVKVVMAPHG